MNHYNEPWREGKGAIVSDSGPTRPGDNEGDIAYYGGYLIGESMPERHAHRAVKCVNAMAGILDPHEFRAVALALARAVLGPDLAGHANDDLMRLMTRGPAGVAAKLIRMAGNTKEEG